MGYKESISELNEKCPENLQARFRKFKDDCDMALSAVNQCSLSMAMRYLAFSSVEMGRLADDAGERYVDGLITSSELTDIIDTCWQVNNDLTDQITDVLLSTCNCKKS